MHLVSVCSQHCAARAACSTFMLQCMALLIVNRQLLTLHLATTWPEQHQGPQAPHSFPATSSLCGGNAFWSHTNNCESDCCVLRTDSAFSCASLALSCLLQDCMVLMMFEQLLHVYNCKGMLLLVAFLR